MKAVFRDASFPRSGRRFTIVDEPPGVPIGVVVGLPAFAEELNKTRRTAAIAARALAASGFLVVRVDPEGCGDSSGDWIGTSWSAWIDDAVDAIRWACGLAGDAPLVIWGTRAGCLLACDAQAQFGRGHLLFWQPQSSGKVVLQQFLRLKMAGQIQESNVKGVTEELRRDLAAGRAVDIAGYQLGPTLANGLAVAQLRPPNIDSETVVTWLEVTSQTPSGLLPASQGIVQRWQQAGCNVRAAAVNAPQFWQSLGIEEAYALVQRTVTELTAIVTSRIPARI